MTLLAYNITGSSVTLVAGNPSPVLPPSASPPTRGSGRDVTSELKGLSAADYALLEAQRPNTIEYEWSGDVEFSLGSLISDAISAHVPSTHASTHATGNTDPLTVASAVAGNQTTIATNQSAAATNQSAVTGVTAGDAAATNQDATATNMGATAVNNDLAFAGSVHLVNPSGASTGTVVSPVTPADGPLIIAGQPDYPRKLQIRIVDGDSSISAGRLDLIGIGLDGADLAQGILLTGGTATVVTDDVYAVLSSATLVNVAGVLGPDSIAIGVGNALGLPIPVGATNVAVHKVTLLGAGAPVDEAVGAGVDTTARSIVPTSVPDGVNDYNFFFSYTVVPTQVVHNHVQDAHNHTQDAHNHGLSDGGHTHVQNTHTHGQNTHNHTQDAHVHNTSG